MATVIPFPQTRPITGVHSIAPAGQTAPDANAGDDVAPWKVLAVVAVGIAVVEGFALYARSVPQHLPRYRNPRRRRRAR